MTKKITYILLSLLCITPVLVYASIGSMTKIGNNYYESLEDAIKNAGPNDIISLISDIKLKETLEINKTVNIDLNGNDIIAPSKVFEVHGGTLNISGTGTIKETEPNYGAIMIKGSTNPSDNEYSVVNVGKNITLEGWSGIFITHDLSKSYGIEVNFGGKINAVSDINGDTGIGIYVNGNIKDKTNSPNITILDGATITSNGTGLYIAGYATFNINEANISGIESGIAIKSGILNIDGAKISGTGPDKTPTEGYNDGVKSSGTAIQIESNNGYSGKIELNIDNGVFSSNNSHTVYEYIGKGNNSQVIALDISGGTFISPISKENFLLSNSLKEYHNAFISGGKYSSNPSKHLKTGYTTVINDNLYNVTKSKVKAVTADNDINTNNKSTILTIIIILSSIILISVVYLNRIKIFDLFKK